MSLVFSQLFIGLGAPSARCCIVGKAWWRQDLCKASRGALSDLLEEDLNSELFNVFLGRQAGEFPSSPPGDAVDGA